MTQSIIASLSDPDRLAAANRALEITGRPDADLDRLCADLAAEVGAPTVVATFVFATRVRAVGSYGVPRFLRSGPARHSLCAYVAAQQRPLVMPNPAAESMLEGCLARFIVKFYCGVPIVVDGQVVGAVGVADRRERRDGDAVLKAATVAAQRAEAILAEKTAAQPDG